MDKPNSLSNSPFLPLSHYDLPPVSTEDAASGGRHDLIARVYVGGTKNWCGSIPLMYELTDRGTLSGWIKYKCICGWKFWSRMGVDKTGGCSRCEGGIPKYTRRRLNLEGKRFGALEVVGHDSGKGWRVRCRCGRERNLLNSTALAAGVYKTCGQCTEEERAAGASSASLAPPSSAGADAVVAVNNSNLPPGGMPTFVFCNRPDHAGYGIIAYPDGGDCPLCMAMARIELLESAEGAR